MQLGLDLLAQRRGQARAGIHRAAAGQNEIPGLAQAFQEVLALFVVVAGIRERQQEDLFPPGIGGMVGHGLGHRRVAPADQPRGCQVFAEVLMREGVGLRLRLDEQAAARVRHGQEVARPGLLFLWLGAFALAKEAGQPRLDLCLRRFGQLLLLASSPPIPPARGVWPRPRPARPERRGRCHPATPTPALQPRPSRSALCVSQKPNNSFTSSSYTSTRRSGNAVRW